MLALDLSKAFDTVRHYKLMEKYAVLDIPENIYNWLVAYFSGHSHCTTYRGQMSDPLQISASVIQGSAIGPASYDVTGSDLAAMSPGNILCKYADDTCIIISQRRMLTPEPQDLFNIETWSRENNLTPDTTKSVEILFTDKYRKCRFKPPPVVSGIDRVSSIKIINNRRYTNQQTFSQ